jgi:ribosomal protein S18 acetylase RimI-like enzyme
MTDLPPTPPLQLRPARRSDIPGMAEVHVRAWDVRSRPLVPEAVASTNTPEARRKRWRGFLAEPANVVRVLEGPGGEVVGFCAGGPEPGGAAGEAQVLGLFLAPEAWGQGHGRRLFRAVCETLAHGGYRRGYLWVLAGNDSARRLYESDGWRVVRGPETDSRGITRVRYAVDWPAPAGGKDGG